MARLVTMLLLSSMLFSGCSFVKEVGILLEEFPVFSAVDEAEYLEEEENPSYVDPMEICIDPDSCDLSLFDEALYQKINVIGETIPALVTLVGGDVVVVDYIHLWVDSTSMYIIEPFSDSSDSLSTGEFVSTDFEPAWHFVATEEIAEISFEPTPYGLGSPAGPVLIGSGSGDRTGFGIASAFRRTYVLRDCECEATSD